MNGSVLSEKTGSAFLNLASVVDLYLLNETRHCFRWWKNMCNLFGNFSHNACCLIFTLIRLFIFRVTPILRLYWMYRKTKRETVTRNL